MEGQTSLVPLERIERAIILVRGEKVMLDSDLAEIYGVETRILNQAVKRNTSRFPSDFMFQLTLEEAEAILRSRSQSVTLKRGQNIKYLPYAFTEHGALMLANVLNSERAAQTSVQRRAGPQAGGDGEEIRRAVQGCLRRNPAANVAASQAKTGDRIPRQG
jgi:hypothetical protein